MPIIRVSCEFRILMGRLRGPKKKIKIKKLQKTKMKTLYASKEENEEMSISKTKISTRMYLRHVIT